MSVEMVVALVAFLALIVAWVALPTRSRRHVEEKSTEVEPA